MLLNQQINPTTSTHPIKMRSINHKRIFLSIFCSFILLLLRSEKNKERTFFAQCESFTVRKIFHKIHSQFKFLMPHFHILAVYIETLLPKSHRYSADQNLIFILYTCISRLNNNNSSSKSLM